MKEGLNHEKLTTNQEIDSVLNNTESEKRDEIMKYVKYQIGDTVALGFCHGVIKDIKIKSVEDLSFMYTIEEAKSHNLYEKEEDAILGIYIKPVPKEDYDVGDIICSKFSDGPSNILRKGNFIGKKCFYTPNRCMPSEIVGIYQEPIPGQKNILERWKAFYRALKPGYYIYEGILDDNNFKCPTGNFPFSDQERDLMKRVRNFWEDRLPEHHTSRSFYGDGGRETETSVDRIDKAFDDSIYSFILLLHFKNAEALEMQENGFFPVLFPESRGHKFKLTPIE